MDKSPDAFRTISEVSAWLDTPTHVLRFWESRFPQVSPIKRAGGRRYYRVEDVKLLGGIKKLLHDDGVTIKALQERLKTEGVDGVAALSPPLGEAAEASEDDIAETEEHTPEPPKAEPDQSELFVPRERAAASTEPTAPIEPETTAEEDSPAPVSFKRHPRKSTPLKPRSEKRSEDSKPHPTRSGLFVYDDSDLTQDTAPAPPPPTRLPDEAPVALQLDPIDGVPADPEDDCPPPDPISLAPELRALALMAPERLPPEAANAVTRIIALRDKLT